MRQIVGMRKLLMILALVSTVALAGISLDTGRRFEFTDCAAGGSAAQTLTLGDYFTRVTTEDVWICYAATCAAGGEKLGAGVAFMLSIPRGGQAISCRSAGATGDVIFTGASQ